MSYLKQIFIIHFSSLEWSLEGRSYRVGLQALEVFFLELWLATGLKDPTLPPQGLNLQLSLHILFLPQGFLG